MRPHQQCLLREGTKAAIEGRGATQGDMFFQRYSNDWGSECNLPLKVGLAFQQYPVYIIVIIIL